VSGFDPTRLPSDLPVPADDGAAEHLVAVLLPDVTLPATDGRSVRLTELGPGRTVIYAYPMTGTPGVLGLSTQPTDVQREAAERLGLPFALLSDAGLELTTALGLPTMLVEGTTMIRRLTLVVRDGRIEHVFHPVFPPDTHAAEVLAWLRDHPG